MDNLDATPTPPAVPAPATEVGGIDASRLRSVVERIERLEAERKELGDAVKDVYDNAGCAGLDVKVVRQVVARRRKERDALEEADSLLELYERALETR